MSILEHPDIQRVTRALAKREPVMFADATMRRAAVALIFRAGGSGEPELLFIRRAEYPGDPWSGQVAFPGGRSEEGDSSLEDTAVRETLEETGIDIRASGRILGALDELQPQSVRLPELVVMRDTEVTGQGIKLARRAFHHEGQVIWGITERIVAQLLSLIAG